MITEIWHQLSPQHHFSLLSFNHTPTNSLSQGSAPTPPHCLQHMGSIASSTMDMDRQWQHVREHPCELVRLSVLLIPSFRTSLGTNLF